MKTIYFKDNLTRLEKYRIATEIKLSESNRKKTVIKKAVTSDAKSQINRISAIYPIYKESILKGNVKIAELIEQDEISLQFEYLDGDNLDIILSNAIKNKQLDILDSNVTSFYNFLYSSFKRVEGFCPTRGFYEFFGDNIDLNKLGNKYSFSVANLDINFDNIVWNEKTNEFGIYDIEWIFDFQIPIDYIFFRALNTFKIRNSTTVNDEIIYSLFKKFKISSEELDIYFQLEKNFMSAVHRHKNLECYFKKNINLFPVQQYQVQLFYSYNNEEFDGTKCLTKDIDKNFGIFHEFEFDLSNLSNGTKNKKIDEENSRKIAKNEFLTKLRLDPLNDSAVITIEELFLRLEDGQEISLLNNIKSNASIAYSKDFFFASNDPQIYIDLSEISKSQNVLSLYIKYKYNHIGRDAVYVTFKQLNTEYKNIAESKTLLEKSIPLLETQISDLAISFNEEKIKNSNLELKNSELNIWYRNILESKILLDKKTSILETQINDLTISFNEEKVRNSNLESLKIELDSKNEKLENQLSSCSLQITELQIKIPNLENKINDLTRNLGEEEQKNANLEREITELKSQSLELRNQNLRLSTQIDAIHKSRSWKLLLIYARLSSIMIPYGSLCRKFLANVYHLVKPVAQLLWQLIKISKPLSKSEKEVYKEIKKSKFFDAKKYRKEHKFLGVYKYFPLKHYIKYGRSQNKLPREVNNNEYLTISRSGLFDSNYYLEQYLDVKKSGIDPIRHYIEFGWLEGRNPSKDFDTSFYLNTYQDVKEAKINPLSHYIDNGMNEGRVKEYFECLKNGSEKINDKDYIELYPSIDSDYFNWYKRFSVPSQVSIYKMNIASKYFKIQPKFIILIFGNNEKLAIESLIKQTYKKFDVLIISNNLLDYNFSDIKIKHVTFDRLENSFKSISGDFFIFLNDSDVMSPQALFEFVVEVNLNYDTGFDIIYSDHDYIEKDVHTNPYFKPDWSPDLLLVNNYIKNACCIKSKMIEEYFPFEVEDPIKIVYSVVIRSLENYSIKHIPHILFSFLKNRDEEVVENDSEIRESVFRKIEKDVVFSSNIYNVPCVMRQIDNQPKVSIIIPTCFKDNYIVALLDSFVSKTSYKNYEIIIIISEEHDIYKDLLSKFYEKVNLNFITYEGAFNWSKVNNYGTMFSSGDIYLFLNDDIEILTNEWLEILVSEAVRPRIGAVGPLMIFSDGLIQHAGVMSINRGGGVIHCFYGHDENYNGFNNFLHYRRNCTGVTGACMMVSKDKFLEIGGFDEGLALVGNDFDFCFKLRKKGYLNLYVPEVKLLHHELVTRKNFSESIDNAFMWNKYRSIFRNGDPFFNPNLIINEKGKIELNWDISSIELCGTHSLSTTNINKILVVKLDHIGDAVLSIPAIRKLRNIFPQANLTILCAPWSKDIFSTQPEINNVLTYEFFDEQSQKGESSNNSEDSCQSLINNLNSKRFDLVVNLRRHECYKHILEKINAPYILSYSTSAESDSISHSFPAIKAIKNCSSKWHISNQLKTLVGMISDNHDNYEKELNIPSEIDKESEELFKVDIPIEFQSTRTIIGIHTQVGSYLRQWPSEYFSVLADMLITSTNSIVLFFGSQCDIQPIEHIISMMKNSNSAISIAGKYSLIQLFSIIKKCNYFIGNNSGLIHISGIQNIPTIGIFSGVVPFQEWNPIGKKIIIVTKKLSCSGCYLSQLSSCNYNYKCMKELYPEDVFHAFEILKAIFPIIRDKKNDNSSLNIGLNIFGFLSSEMGIGQAARNNISALKKSGEIDFSLNDIEFTPHSKNYSFLNNHKNKRKNQYLINYIHIGPDAYQDVVQYIKYKQHYNIAYWAWELPIFSHALKKNLGLINEIWTPSNFSYSAIKNETNLPVMVLPHPIKISINKNFSRDYFNLPQDKFLLLNSFDLYSNIERKNPYSVIKTYINCKKSLKNIALVLKVSHVEQNEKDFQTILNIVSNIEDIYIINKVLNIEEIHSLQNICDAYISLHRSEGFGLSLAESMYLGKPVIATNWSGNVDFMKDYNSCLVNFKLVDVNSVYHFAEAGSKWADPDIDHAEYYVKKLYSNTQFYNKISHNAKEYISQNLSEDKVATDMNNRIRYIYNNFV